MNEFEKWWGTYKHYEADVETAEAAFEAGAAMQREKGASLCDDLMGLHNSVSVKIREQGE